MVFNRVAFLDLSVSNTLFNDLFMGKGKLNATNDEVSAVSHTFIYARDVSDEFVNLLFLILVHLSWVDYLALFYVFLC